MQPGFDENYTWSWLFEDIDWIPYDSRTNDEIERSYFNGDAFVDLKHDQYQFDKNFIYFLPNQFFQLNESTNLRCKVQRDPPKVRDCVIDWEWNDGDKWVGYDSASSEILEKSYSGGDQIAQLNDNDIVQFGDTFIRISANDKKVKIRRVVKFRDLIPSPNLPPLPPKNNFHIESSECPICFVEFPTSEIITHVNYCLESLDQNEKSPENYPGGVPQNVVIKKDEYDPVTKEKFDCPICFTDVAVGGGYQFKGCGHKYCGDCLNGYYTELIKNGKVMEVKCPDPICEYECTFQDVQFVVAKEVADKYVEFKRVAVINSDPEMRWCPNPTGCGNAFRREDPTSLRMLCDECDHDFCFSCGDDFHDKKSCDEYAKWKVLNNKIDIRVFLWQRLNTKSCPNCNARIEKKGGCNHMTCGSCDYEFCWQCMKKYDYDHYDNSWCTQYGKSPTLHYAKEIGKKLVSALPFLPDYSSGYSSSDDETIGEKFEALGEKMQDVKENLGEKIQDVKEEVSERWQNTKEKATETFLKFKSIFDK